MKKPLHGETALSRFLKEKICHDFKTAHPKCSFIVHQMYVPMQNPRITARVLPVQNTFKEV